MRWNLPKDQIGGDWKHPLSLKDRDQHCCGCGGYDQTRIYFIGGEDSEACEQGHDGWAWVLSWPCSGTVQNRRLLLLSLGRGVTLYQRVSSPVMLLSVLRFEIQ